MWCDPNYSNLCPECGANLAFKLPPGYDSCGQLLVKCPKETCKFHRWICLNCNSAAKQRRRSTNKPHLTNDSTKNQQNSCSKLIMWSVLVVMTACFVLYCLTHSSQSLEDGNLIIIENFRKDFPSQRNETWYHLLSVLEKDNPSVKSVIFLHGEDKKTSDCLTNRLISVYSGNKDIKREKITFSKTGYEAMDYGFALEHYHQIVKTYRVFVTDLTTVPGNIARIFHSLCDEVSSDIKPSLFIFTLRFDERTKELKSMERASAILKEAWSDLPANEIFPLLSRIVKNVVDIVPEIRLSC